MTAEEQVSRLSAKIFGSRWAPDRFDKDYGPGLTRMPDVCEFDFRHGQLGARIELKAARWRREDGFVFSTSGPTASTSACAWAGEKTPTITGSWIGRRSGLFSEGNTGVSIHSS